MKNELTNFNEKEILEENETVFSLKKNDRILYYWLVRRRHFWIFYRQICLYINYPSSITYSSW